MKNIFFLLTIAIMVSCNNNNGTTEVVVPGIDTSNFDKSIALNDNFYQFSTGGWQKNNPLRDEFARYGSFDVLRENNEKRLNDLFKEMSSKESMEGSVERKISDLYKMGLDSERLNREGAAPVLENIKRILAVNSKKDIARMVAEMHNVNENVLFASGVGADLINSNINVFYIQQSGLGMGNRDYYTNKDNENIKTAYEEYLKKIVTLAGFSKEEADKMVADDMEIENAIADKSSTNVELRDIEKNYNPMSKVDFQKRYAAFDWDEYYNTLGVPAFDTLILGQPKAIEAVNDILDKMPVEKINNYIAVQMLNGSANFLSDDFSLASFEFYGKVMSGAKEQKPRWKRAMSIPNGILSEAVGEIYVSKYFKPEDKERVLGIVKNLQKSLGEHIAALDWMSDSTKIKAQDKLSSFTVKIGYPDKWKDYSTLSIDPSLSYWDNVVAASKWYVNDNIKDLGKPVDREKWYMSPQTVNAYYNPTTNEICFPAAILQPPFYNPNADDAVNYGAIGVVIGHEMTHGFDDQGRLFDKNGNMNNWWTEKDSKAFKEKTDILVAQFDSIEVLPGVKADGKLSLGENIADQGGLRIAYTAFKNSQIESGNNENNEKIDGYTQDQRFYLAYAQVWAQNIRNEEIIRLTKQDVHSLGVNRVNATLKNIEDFYKAFNITSGKMFLPKEQRVIIW